MEEDFFFIHNNKMSNFSLIKLLYKKNFSLPYENLKKNADGH